MSDSPQRATVDIDVRYAETDAQGVVHHSVYIVWFEVARTSLCDFTGYHYAAIEDMGYALVVTRSEVRYGAAAHYGDTLAVSCWLEKMASRSVKFQYEVRRKKAAVPRQPSRSQKDDAAGQLLASGSTEHIWVELATGRPCRIPEALKEPFSRLA